MAKLLSNQGFPSLLSCDKEIAIRTKEDDIPRKPDFRPLKHESILGKPYLSRYQGRSRVMIDILCPRCKETRQRPASETRNEMRRPNFRGFCRACSLASVKDGSHRWMMDYRDKKTPYRSNTGYVLISHSEVSDELLPIYRAMQRCGQPVSGHRWAMAKHLGRALTSNELIDHMDGNRTNNNIENLRIYVRGKQQPGSATGHGTYYDEWQRALAEIRKLKRNHSKPT